MQGDVELKLRNPGQVKTLRYLKRLTTESLNSNERTKYRMRQFDQ